MSISPREHENMCKSAINYIDREIKDESRDMKYDKIYRNIMIFGAAANVLSSSFTLITNPEKFYLPVTALAIGAAEGLFAGAFHNRYKKKAKRINALQTLKREKKEALPIEI